MEITSPESILAMLGNCTNRFSCRGNLWGVDDNLVTWAHDETGMVDTSLFCSNHQNNKQLALVEQQEGIRVMRLEVPEEVLQIHGVALASKLEAIIWLIYENVNGISNKLNNNEKAEKAKEIHDELEVNIVAYNKHRLNMQDQQNVNVFNQLFKEGKAAIQSMATHNVHKDFGHVQERGNSLLAFGTITEHLVYDQPRKDGTGLGRWLVMAFKGGNGLTCVVCGYNPCYNAKPDSRTTYQQHLCYFITQRKDLTCPWVNF
jgi:hypothetical protein